MPPLDALVEDSSPVLIDASGLSTFAACAEKVLPAETYPCMRWKGLGPPNTFSFPVLDSEEIVPGLHAITSKGPNGNGSGNTDSATSDEPGDGQVDPMACLATTGSCRAVQAWITGLDGIGACQDEPTAPPGKKSLLAALGRYGFLDGIIGACMEATMPSSKSDSSCVA